MRNSWLRLWIISVVAITLAIIGISNAVLAAKEAELKSPIPNEVCLECHDTILEWTTKKKNILQPHRRHLESKKTEYEGRHKRCVTCHEAMVPTEEGKGIMEGDIYHPAVALKPDAFWKRTIVREKIISGTPVLDAVHPEKPYTFKPLLERLVCLDCHGPDSKVKTFYGTSLEK